MSRMQRATQMLGAIAAPVASSVASFPTKYNEWLGQLPSTNFRIQWSVVFVGGTAVRYWLEETTWTVWRWSMHLGKWEPSYEWLAFLLLLCGVDTMQFKWKRENYKPAYDTRQNRAGTTADAATPGASL